MIITGKEALDLEIKETDDFGESAIYKLKSGDSVNMVFLNGIDGIISWLQHNWWKVDRYSNNPGGYEVTDNVIFTCLKEHWSTGDNACPGHLFGDDGEQKWCAVVLVEDRSGEETVIKEKVFFFGKSIWNGIKRVREDIKSEFGDDEELNDKWLRLSNSGEGADRYNVSFMGKFYKDYKTYTPELDATTFVKQLTFPEVVENMRNAGLPIDEKLAENDLNDLGLPIAKTEDKAKK